MTEKGNTKQVILTAALDLFSVQGFEATSMSQIAEEEKANENIVALAALLHDVDDRKISPQTYQNKENAVNFLKSKNIPASVIAQICKIIDEVSFSNSSSFTTIEGKCVQDADRLDALGAVGIARAFAYGGSHNRCIWSKLCDILQMLVNNLSCFVIKK